MYLLFKLFDFCHFFFLDSKAFLNALFSLLNPNEERVLFLNFTLGLLHLQMVLRLSDETNTQKVMSPTIGLRIVQLLQKKIIHGKIQEKCYITPK